MIEREIILLAVLAPVLTGLATLALPRGLALARTLLALCGQGGAFALLVGLVGAERADSVGWEYLPSLGIDFFFRADQLGLFFALLVSGIGSLIVPYAHAYFRSKPEPIGRLLPMLGLFSTAMLGVALSDSMLGLFIFWELTTVSSFLLIGWDRASPTAVRSALQAAVITGTGGLALLLGLVVLHDASGSWRLSEIDLSAAPAWQTVLALSLLGVAAGTKSAQFPLHAWLPGAMAAPTPVSAYLHSATMVKAGVFLLGRVLPGMGTEELWPVLFVPLGALTMAYAAVQALRADSVKRMLAFSTVSQLGLFVCMYGLGGVHAGDEHTLKWPVAQILNHAMYKAPLFMLAGTMAVHAKVVRIDQLGGFVRRMPVVGWLFIVGLFAMAAGPGTFSFGAKELFVLGALHAGEVSWLGWCAVGGVVIAAACNAALLVRLARVMLRGSDDAQDEVLSGSVWMWWPAALLLILQLVGGLVPGGLGFVSSVETDAHGTLPTTWYIFSHANLALAVSIGALVLGVVLGLSPVLRRVGGDPCDRVFPTVHRLLESVAFTTVNLLQSGSIRRYLAVSIGVLAGGLLLVMSGDERWLRVPWFVDLFDADLGIVSLALFSALFVCVSALALPATRLRIVRVLVLGAVGFGVTLLYLVNRAPDLALTQIMFEIISVIMFLLVMRMLPERTRADQERIEISRAIFAGVVGVVVGWAVFHAASVPDSQRYVDEIPALIEAGAGEARPAQQADERLGPWFLRHSYYGSEETGGRGGGGDNVVNVILVDFRGYDTMGEICVLAIAMIAVLTMLGPRRLRPALHGNDVRVPGVTYGEQFHLTSSMLRVGVRVIVPLVLIFAAYVFFKGHQLPGGGFIAGLIASVGIAIYRMTEGRGAFLQLVPIRPGVLVGTGLLIALATGLVPLVLSVLGGGSVPFLTSGQEYLPLPGGIDTFHLTSVMFFDLGVFIVVVGVSVVMINRLEEELE